MSLLVSNNSLKGTWLICDVCSNLSCLLEKFGFCAYIWIHAHISWLNGQKNPNGELK